MLGVIGALSCSLVLGLDEVKAYPEAKANKAMQNDIRIMQTAAEGMQRYERFTLVTHLQKVLTTCQCQNFKRHAGD